LVLLEPFLFADFILILLIEEPLRFSREIFKVIVIIVTCLNRLDIVFVEQCRNKLFKVILQNRLLLNRKCVFELIFAKTSRVERVDQSVELLFGEERPSGSCGSIVGNAVN